MTNTAESKVYIVGGLPRAGKSTLATRLSQTLGIGCLETDHVRALFDADPTSPIGYAAQAKINACTKAMRPYLVAFVDNMISAKTGVVVTGETIHPKMIAALDRSEAARACFMGMQDADAAFLRIRRHDDPGDWAQRLPDDTLQNILGEYALRSIKLASSCSRLGIPYFDSSYDFETTQREAFSYMAYAADLRTTNVTE